MRSIAVRIGLISTLLIALLAAEGGTAAANPGVPWIGPHSDGNAEAVRCVQSAVGATVDGDFGSETMQRIIQIQASAGLQADGTVGPRTGDYLLPLTYDPGYCANLVPTTYEFVVDNTLTPPPDPGTRQNDGDLGATPSLGKPLPACVAQGIKGSLLGAGRLAKIIWKRRMPTPAEWAKAPNPVLFTGSLMYCYIFADNENTH